MSSTLLHAITIAIAAAPFVAAVGGVVGAFVAVCHGAGRLLVDGDDAELGDRLVLSWPIGSVLLGLAAFTLAAAGQLSPLSCGVVGLLILCSTHRRWRRDLGDVLVRLRTMRAERSLRRAVGLAGVGFLLTTFGLLLRATYPRLGFDETLYHLPFTRAMLETGALPLLPHLRYPIFPNLQEALWTPLLDFLGQSGPSVLVAVQTAWVGLLLAFWVGGRLGLGYGILAASLWLGCPISWWTGTEAMVDVALALYVTVTAICVDRWETTRQSRWLALAGVAVGGGAATKYHGLLVLVLVVGALLLGIGFKRRLVALVPLLASAALVLLPVYGWITVTTGNPVFPFASGTFGVSEWSQHTRKTGGPEAASRASVGTVVAVRFAGALQRLDEVPSALGRLTIPGRIENAPPPLSVWLLLLAPAGVLALRKPPWRRPRRWALLFLVYFLIWFATATESRYLYSALPLLIPLYVTGLARFVPLRRGVAIVGALLLLLPGITFAAHELARLGPLPTSALTRENFLYNHRPGYQALREAEAHWAGRSTDGRPPRIFTLFGSDLQYFARAPLHGDWFGPDRYSRYGDFRQPDIVEQLRAEGFDYALEVFRSSPPTLDAFPGLDLRHRDEQSELWVITP